MRSLSDIGKEMIVVALRDPYDLLELPDGVAGIAAWEYSSRSLESLVPFLKGEREFTGIMPLVLNDE